MRKEEGVAGAKSCRIEATEGLSKSRAVAEVDVRSAAISRGFGEPFTRSFGCLPKSIGGRDLRDDEVVDPWV